MDQQEVSRVAGYLMWFIETQNGLFHNDWRDRELLDTLHCTRDEFETAWHHIMSNNFAALGTENELHSWSDTFVSSLMGKIE